MKGQVLDTVLQGNHIVCRCHIKDIYYKLFSTWKNLLTNFCRRGNKIKVCLALKMKKTVETFKSFKWFLDAKIVCIPAFCPLTLRIFIPLTKPIAQLLRTERLILMRFIISHHYYVKCFYYLTSLCKTFMLDFSAD